MPEKYQDEIEEILKGIEEEGPAVLSRNSQPILDDLPRPRSDALSRGIDRDPNRGEPSSRSRFRWQSVTPGKVALASLALLLLGFLLRSAGGGWLVWAGMLGLAAAYLLFFVRPRQVNQDKRWRGRAVESQGPSPWRKFRRWLSD